MPSLVLAIMLVRPFTLMFSRSLGSPVSVSSACQCNMCNLFSSPHRLWESQFKHVGCRGCVACWQSHSHFKLLPTNCLKLFCSTWHRCTDQGLRLATTLQVLTPVQVLLYQWLLMTSLSTVWSEGTALVPSLANLTASTQALDTIKTGQRG